MVKENNFHKFFVSVLYDCASMYTQDWDLRQQVNFLGDLRQKKKVFLKAIVFCTRHIVYQRQLSTYLLTHKPHTDIYIKIHRDTE